METGTTSVSQIVHPSSGTPPEEASAAAPVVGAAAARAPAASQTPSALFAAPYGSYRSGRTRSRSVIGRLEDNAAPPSLGRPRRSSTVRSRE
jgi:hypothetical protein